MQEKIFGYDKEDWDRWQAEHKEFYDSLEGLEQVPLWGDGAPGFKEEYQQRPPRLALLPAQAQPRGAVLICPGGGYQMKSVFEGRMVAQKFHDYGFNAAVLDYRCGPYSIEQALDDAQRAVRLLRANATAWNIKPDKIAIGGFSAGGHLSSMAGTQYGNANTLVNDEVDNVSCRPDAVLQCYGAIPIDALRRFVGEDTPSERIQKMDIPLNVTADTPPFFMWMTGQDEGIPRSAMYDIANALEACHVPYELHLFPNGIHGVALADGSSKFGKKDPHTNHWVMLACEWLQEQGF